MVLYTGLLAGCRALMFLKLKATPHRGWKNTDRPLSSPGFSSSSTLTHCNGFLKCVPPILSDHQSVWGEDAVESTEI